MKKKILITFIIVLFAVFILGSQVRYQHVTIEWGIQRDSKKYWRILLPWQSGEVNLPEERGNGYRVYRVQREEYLWFGLKKVFDESTSEVVRTVK